MIYIDIATLFMDESTNPVEVYVPLWFANGTSVSAGTNVTTAGTKFIADDSSGTAASTNLFTLSSGWSNTQKFAFEATISLNSGTGTCYAKLWDVSSGTAIASSQVSNTTTTMIVIRSGQFTLTSGHTYGVTIWSSSSSYSAAITDASLIIFP